ncbi:MAG: hypothetical protein R3251_03040 [Candidatus Spechtbacterales bacterium]|nr:hypothetical protein [Candidatus Spechtbacterales bacterium]
MEKLRQIPKKQALLGFVFIVSNMVFWPLLTLILALRITNPLYIIALIFMGFLVTVTFGLLQLFVSKYLRFILYALLTILLLGLYRFEDLNFIGVFLFSALILVAHWRAERVKRFIAEFKPFYMLRRFMPIFFTGMAIVLAFVYNSFILQYYVDNPQIPKQAYSTVFRPAEAFLQIPLPGYRPGMTMEEFQEVVVSSVFTKFLPQNEAGRQIDFENIDFPDFLGESVADVTVEEFTLAWINQTMNTILAPYLDLLPALFVVGLFLVFRFILLPFLWAAKGLTLLAIELLLLYNIIVEKEIQTTKKIRVLE